MIFGKKLFKFCVKDKYTSMKFGLIHVIIKTTYKL